MVAAWRAAAAGPARARAAGDRRRRGRDGGASLTPRAPRRAAHAGKVGAEVVEAACVIELPALKGREKLEGLPLFVLIEKEGE